MTASAKALGQAGAWHIIGTKKWLVPLDSSDGRITVQAEDRVGRVISYRDLQARAKGLDFYPSVVGKY